MAHPEIFPKILTLALHHAQDAGNLACAPRRLRGVHASAVVAIGNVDASVAGNRMRVNRQCRHDTMFPLLLHFSMHDEQRVVRQMYRDLALGIRVLRGPGLGVLGEHAAHPKLARNAQRYGANNGTRPEIGELVAVVADALLGAVIAIDKCRVWGPGLGALIFELLAARISSFDAMLYFLIYCFLNNGLHF